MSGRVKLYGKLHASRGREAQFGAHLAGGLGCTLEDKVVPIEAENRAIARSKLVKWLESVTPLRESRRQDCLQLAFRFAAISRLSGTTFLTSAVNHIDHVWCGASMSIVFPASSLLAASQSSCLRDSENAVIGGLNAELRWTWLFIAEFWLPEDYRHQGHGSNILARAEAFARAEGATACYLDTLEFQALEFYQHRGYEVYGVLDNFPPGFRRFYLRKSLGELGEAE